ITLATESAAAILAIRMVHSRSQDLLQASTYFDPISFRPDGRRQGYFANISRRRETAGQLVRREPQEEGSKMLGSTALDWEAWSHRWKRSGRLPGDRLLLSRDGETAC